MSTEAPAYNLTPGFAVRHPFGQLVMHAERMATRAASMPPADAAQQALGLPAGTTKLNALLHLLDVNGRMSSIDLARAMQLDTNRVWGLFKTPRERGQVIYFEGLWELDREYVGREQLEDGSMSAATNKRQASEAVQLLEQAGYTWKDGVLWSPPVGRAPLFAEQVPEHVQRLQQLLTRCYVALVAWADVIPSEPLRNDIKAAVPGVV